LGYIDLEFSFDFKQNRNQESAGITDLVMDPCTASPVGTCGDGLTGNNVICENNEQTCEVLAKLQNGKTSRENCNTWCKNLGLTCERAWNDENKSCTKKQEITCSTIKPRYSICQCTASTAST